MYESTGRTPHVSNGLKAGLSALIAVCVLLIVGSGPATAAEGDPFEVDFNYVGFNIDATLTEFNDLALTPDTVDPEGDPLGALELRGSFDDGSGNFTLPKETGLEFPPILLDVSGGELSGDFALVEDAKGNFNPATGAMTLNPKISLTIGTPNIRLFPEELLSIIRPMLPEGDAPYPVSCRFSPLELSLSTANAWPAPGTPFTGTAGPTPTEGAVSGAWLTKPEVESLAGPAICGVFDGLIYPVGGLWLANSSNVYEEMPAATAPRPEPPACGVNQTGEYPDCVDKPPTSRCAPPQTGTPPNCVGPPTERSAEITKVAITPAKGTIKAGKSLKVKVKVTNTGNEVSGAIKVSLKSTNKKVTLPKSVTVNVAAGKTVTKTVTVKASKKAKGKATITAKYGSKSGKSVLTVKKTKRKK